MSLSRSRGELSRDQYDSPSIGYQHNSQKETMPEYSFGTSTRAAHTSKHYLGAKHEKKKAVMNSPGPVYAVPTTTGDGPKFGFGTEQRAQTKAQYPDSSVDLTCSLVDSQVLKFQNTKAVHFGTESRMNSKNAEAILMNPQVMMGTQSPIGFDYEPNDSIISKSSAEYSFGPKNGKASALSRLQLPLTSTPRHVGPGSHQQPSGCGDQPSSAKKSAPSWSFGIKTGSYTPRNRNSPLLDTSPELSSLGKQVVSSARSAPSCGFGTSTRDHSARTHLLQTKLDKGPAAQMDKPRFHLEMPPPEKPRPKPGL